MESPWNFSGQIGYMRAVVQSASYMDGEARGPLGGLTTFQRSLVTNQVDSLQIVHQSPSVLESSNNGGGRGDMALGSVG